MKLRYQCEHSSFDSHLRGRGVKEKQNISLWRDKEENWKDQMRKGMDGREGSRREYREGRLILEAI